METRKGFVLDHSAGYFRNQGVDIMAFDDIYPEGHRSGVSRPNTSWAAAPPTTCSSCWLHGSCWKTAEAASSPKKPHPRSLV